MNVYSTQQIRNVILLGHGGAGKTTVAEALAHVTGITKRLGSVPEGNTISDYDKEEIKRQFSISTSVIPLEFKGENGALKINILDTPGYFDFVGEVEEAASVADAAVIVVNCKAGIQPGTIKAWDMCEEYNLPRVIFVTNMDDNQASFRELLLKLEKQFGRKIAPFQVPIRENEQFVGFANVVKMKGRRFTKLSDYEECEIPDYVMKNLSIARDALIEAVAETDEAYMERYFAGEEFTTEEIQAALRQFVCTGEMVPVIMGSGVNCQGFNFLLHVIDRYLPGPDHFECVGKDLSTGEMFSAKFNEEASRTVKVWKTVVDPFIGRYSLLKVVTGTLKPDTTIYNVTKDAEEKIQKLYVLRGKEAIEVPELRAGDIGALAKLSVTETGDTMAVRNAPVQYDPPKISTPYTYMAYAAKTKGDEDKISNALSRLMEEDLTLKVVNDTENRQSLLYGIGDQQLEVVVSKLKERYKVEVELSKPKFAFRETIRKKVEKPGRYKKQSGGHGQFGDVWIEFEPTDSESLVFEEKIFGGSVPKNFFPAIEKGLQDSVKKGVLAGCPVVGIKATLLDGSYHPVDSSEMAFKIAASLAFKEGMKQANPILLEPIGSLKVTIPDDKNGDIMGDINKRRGRVLGMEPSGEGMTTIAAEVPVREMHDFTMYLRQVAKGMGEFTFDFERYEPLPANLIDEVVASVKSDDDDE